MANLRLSNFHPWSHPRDCLALLERCSSWEVGSLEWWWSQEGEEEEVEEAEGREEREEAVRQVVPRLPKVAPGGKVQV